MRNPRRLVTAAFVVAAALMQPAPAHRLAIAQTASSPASSRLLDINTATPAQLKALPGMGDAYVQRLIEGRPYTAKNQLTTRGILPQNAYEQIKGRIIAHRPRTQ
jgi:DNA uptake protein ComE-like DNA-binding protein